MLKFLSLISVSLGGVIVITVTFSFKSQFAKTTFFTASLLPKETYNIARKLKYVRTHISSQIGSNYKYIFFPGAFVGVGFGIYRLCQGQPGRAALEVASGAVSCIPGKVII